MTARKKSFSIKTGVTFAGLALGIALVIVGVSAQGYELLLIGGITIASLSGWMIFLDWKKPDRILGSTLNVPGEASKNVKTPPSKLPTGIPSARLPSFVSRQKIPITLIAAGLAFVVSAIYFLAGTQYALFTGLFIPGVLLLGLGVLRLYARPTGTKRFCMNCGYQMLSTDFVCGRCGKQPPSGVDTKTCPNCSAVIPAVARFCKDCGAGQPTVDPYTVTQIGSNPPSAPEV